MCEAVIKGFLQEGLKERDDWQRLVGRFQQESLWYFLAAQEELEKRKSRVQQRNALKGRARAARALREKERGHGSSIAAVLQDWRCAVDAHGTAHWGSAVPNAELHIKEVQCELAASIQRELAAAQDAEHVPSSVAATVLRHACTHYLSQAIDEWRQGLRQEAFGSVSKYLSLVRPEKLEELPWSLDACGVICVRYEGLIRDMMTVDDSADQGSRPSEPGGAPAAGAAPRNLDSAAGSGGVVLTPASALEGGAASSSDDRGSGLSPVALAAEDLANGAWKDRDFFLKAKTVGNGRAEVTVYAVQWDN